MPIYGTSKLIPQLDIVEQFFEDRERGNIRDTYFSLWKKRSGGGHITNVDLGWGRALLEGKMTHLISYGGGGGAQSARANFKDSYLRNEYHYSTEIW